MSSRVTRDHHRWTRDIKAPQNTEIDVTGNLTLDISGDITVDADGGSFNIQDDTPGTATPTLKLYSTNTSTLGPYLIFQHDSSSPALGDDIGSIVFYGEDSGSNVTQYASMIVEIQDTTDGGEEAKIRFGLTTGDGSSANGLQMTGNSGKVDVEIAHGSTSTTDIEGTLNIKGNSITSNGNLAITPGGGHVNIASTQDEDPELGLISDSNDANSGKLSFLKTRGNYTTAGQDGDAVGEIIFSGYNDAGTPEYIEFGQIKGFILDASDGAEEGKLTLGVASHDGEMQNGIIIQSGNIEDEVDVLLGNGSSSRVTIEGNLDIDGSVITSEGALEIDPGGAFPITGQAVSIDSGQALYLDGGGNTYISEASADSIRAVVGGDVVLMLTEAGTAGNIINAGSSAIGFTQSTGTFNTTDSHIKFHITGNKSSLTLTDNVTNLNLTFPNVSCNCVLLLTQDGTGSRTITNWKTFDQASGNESTVKFAGGSNPTLTTTANKTDIISFYWDNTNHIAYGVATLNF